jgi:septum site-determining protein MinD
LDAPSGVGIGFSLAAQSADRVVLVSGYDSAALRNAARAVQELELMGKKQVQLIVNRLQKKQLSKMKLTVDDIIDRVGAPLVGLVPEDDGVLFAAVSGKPLLKQTKKGAAAACVRIAKRIQGKQEPIAI